MECPISEKTASPKSELRPRVKGIRVSRDPYLNPPHLPGRRNEVLSRVHLPLFGRRAGVKA